MLSPQSKLIYLAQSQLHKVEFYWNYRIIEVGELNRNKGELKIHKVLARNPHGERTPHYCNMPFHRPCPPEDFFFLLRLQNYCTSLSVYFYCFLQLSPACSHFLDCFLIWYLNLTGIKKKISFCAVFSSHFSGTFCIAFGCRIWNVIGIKNFSFCAVVFIQRVLHFPTSPIPSVS